MRKRIATLIARAMAVIFPICMVCSGEAQSKIEPKPSFEVVSIRIAENCGNVAPGVTVKIPGGTRYQPGGRYTTCGQLQYIIREAYPMDLLAELPGIPRWADDILYKIEAKAEGSPDKEQMHLMVQSLLDDRFKLKMHRELRETQVYALVVAGGGHKLQLAKDEQGNPVKSLPPPEQTQQQLAGQSIPPSLSTMRLGSMRVMGKPDGSSELIGKAISMEAFSKILNWMRLGRKVIDKTNLAGLYDIRLSFANPFNVAAAAESSAPSIPTALKEQLGLKLEASKALVDFFVIDSVEKPSEN